MSVGERAVGIPTAERLASEHYGLRAAAKVLPGELDDNFELTAADGRRYVLKVLAGAGGAALQDAALEHLAATAAAGLVPRVVPSLTGDPRVRLLTWLDGTPWARRPGDPADLGGVVATVDAALASFEHPAMGRPHPWNVLSAPAAAAHVALAPAELQPRLREV